MWVPSKRRQRRSPKIGLLKADWNGGEMRWPRVTTKGRCKAMAQVMEGTTQRRVPKGGWAAHGGEGLELVADEVDRPLDRREAVQRCDGGRGGGRGACIARRGVGEGGVWDPFSQRGKKERGGLGSPASLPPSVSYQKNPWGGERWSSWGSSTFPYMPVNGGTLVAKCQCPGSRGERSGEGPVGHWRRPPVQ